MSLKKLKLSNDVFLVIVRALFGAWTYILKPLVSCEARIRICLIVNRISYPMKHADRHHAVFGKCIDRVHCFPTREAYPGEDEFRIENILIVNRKQTIDFVNLEAVSLGVIEKPFICIVVSNLDSLLVRLKIS